MADLKSQLKEVVTKATEKIKAGASLEDFAKEYYTHDCKLLAPGKEKVIEGHDNKELIDEFDKRIKVWGNDIVNDQEELIDLGDMAVDRGSYGFKAADGTIKAKGLFVQVWKKVDGQWKVYMDIFTA